MSRIVGMGAKEVAENDSTLKVENKELRAVNKEAQELIEKLYKKIAELEAVGVGEPPKTAKTVEKK